MSSEEARLDLTVDAGGALVLSGEIDSFTAPELAQRLATDAIDVVDLSAVTFIDSSGLRVLVQANEARTEAGQKLTLRTPSTPVQRLLEISGLADHLEIA